MRRLQQRLLIGGVPLLLATVAFVQGCSEAPSLEPWHTERLTAEFEAGADVHGFADYLALEAELFAELETKVYERTGTGPEFALIRYSSGSPADPRDDQPDWNRSFELTPQAARGGVLLLHGMSDSPYSLRAMGETLVDRGYHVVGLRLPGHGTAPSGLRHVRVADLEAATRLAMDHIAKQVGGKPVHLVGYSMGAPLAVSSALDALEEEGGKVPASLVLISPAVRIHRAAGLARFKNGLSAVPGFGGLAWLQVLPEFDPYKYNSFATNAGDVVHRITRSVERRVAARARSNPSEVLPPLLVFKSTVDATVSTDAVVDRLLARLAPHRHELVLFDINRFAAKSALLVADPAPFTHRLLNDGSLPFALTLVANEHENTPQVVARRKAPLVAELAAAEPLGLSWPPGVVSLSHVALPISPDDPLYGRRPPRSDTVLFLGQMAIQGERGLLKLPSDWLLRLRHNPFYAFLERRTLDWFEAAGSAASAQREPRRGAIHR